MECMNKCGTELTGRQKRFCSDKCRMAQTRTKSNAQQAGERPNANKPEQAKVEQTNPNKVDLATCSDSRLEQHYAKPANFGQPDCQCQMCRTNRVNGNKHTINHGAYKQSHELYEHELNRVTLPSDADYIVALTACF